MSRRTQSQSSCFLCQSRLSHTKTVWHTGVFCIQRVLPPTGRCRNKPIHHSVSKKDVPPARVHYDQHHRLTPPSPLPPPHSPCIHLHHLTLYTASTHTTAQHHTCQHLHMKYIHIRKYCMAFAVYLRVTDFEKK